MRILAAVVLIICLVAILVISYTVPRTRLTPAERAQAVGACTQCHGFDDDREGGDFEGGDVHQIHGTVDCLTCHSSVSGMKTADTASKTLKWVGIGFVSVVVAGMALNYVVVRGRLKGQEVDDGKPDD
jgi:ABC-type Fe3+ transport system permease subunit